MASPAHPIGWTPASRVEGTLRPPGSKSQAIRVLFAAGLAEGRTSVIGLPDGDDVAACLDVLLDCGVRCDVVVPGAVIVQGRPPGSSKGWKPRVHDIDVRESGTVARFAFAALGLAATEGAHATVVCRRSLRERPMIPLLRALRAAGAGIEGGGGRMPASPASTWPLRIRACAPPKVVTLLEPVSSQEASALLLALSAWIQTTRLHVWGPVPSEPFFELTRHVLDPFGARVRTSFEPEVELLALELAQRYPDQAGGERDSLTLSHCLEIHGPLVAPRKEIVIGADAGLGAVALVAGCLSGGRVELDDIGHVSRQPDSAIAERLADFGCDVSWCGNALVGAGRPTRAAAVDLTGAPDLAPLLAVVAAAATRSSGEPSILSGLGSLRHKESDRLEGLAHLLRSAGFAAEVHVDALFVGPESEARGSGPLLVDPRGDHRMAYAGALLGLLVPDVLVTDPGCVRKTWPAFWDELEALGAVTVRG